MSETTSCRDTLVQLLELQDLDDRVRNIHKTLDNIPTKLQDMADRAKEERDQFEITEVQLKEAKSRRDIAEMETKVLADKIKSFREKMPSLRSNDEYSAIIKEIDHQERQKKVLEDEILTLMETIETSETSLPNLKESLATKEAESDSDRAALKEEEDAFGKELGQLETRREGMVETMDEDLLSTFERIASGRAGVALAEVADNGTCGQCHRALRPHLVQRIQRVEEVIQCEGCKRILYIEAALEVSSTDHE